MLFSERLRERERLDAEARGENLWSDTVTPPLRMKVRYAFLDAAAVDDNAEQALTVAHRLVVRAEGLPFLTRGGIYEAEDFLAWLDNCGTAQFATAIEALFIALGRVQLRAFDGRAVASFASRVREVFAGERFAFDFIEGKVVPLGSQELHVAIVEPVLRLLSGTAGFDKAEAAYQEALKELSAGEAADAVTDAARALQEALMALGCAGNALGPLLASARSKGLVSGHDMPLGDAVVRAAHWVSADRSEMGDAHKARARNRDDAWFTVHVVGALILRLAAGTPRGE